MSQTEPPPAPSVRRRVGTLRRPPLPRTLASGWRAAAREFAVIVAGVLAALGAQAWWDHREEREREREYLVQLLADTRENESRLDRAIGQDSLAQIAARRVAEALYGPGPLPPPDTMAAWFTGGAFSSSDFRPLSGTYGALLAGGDLRIIRTDSLRVGLVAYSATLEHERLMLQFFLEQGFGDAGSVVRSLPFMRRLFSADRDAFSEEARRFDFERLREDQGLAAALFAVQISNQNRITHLRRLRDETRQLRRLLEAEPGLPRETAAGK